MPSRSELRQLILDCLEIKVDTGLILSIYTVEEWDSIGHMMIISHIEKTYSVSIPPKDLVQLLDEEVIYDYLQSLSS